MVNTDFAIIAQFFMQGIMASHALYVIAKGNNGNLDVTIHLRGWKVQDYFNANPVGKLSQAPEPGPETDPRE